MFKVSPSLPRRTPPVHKECEFEVSLLQDVVEKCDDALVLKAADMITFSAAILATYDDEFSLAYLVPMLKDVRESMIANSVSLLHQIPTRYRFHEKEAKSSSQEIVVNVRV